MSYRMGQRIRFVDDSATVSADDEIVMHEGNINGQPIYGDDGELLFVPVFATRDKGREPTTIFVHGSNVLGEVEGA